jgi:hemolysin-activating ACP:hemolysin acyltransferase
MKFKEADKLCARIIRFMRKQGGPYITADQDYLQWVVLTALATKQYELKQDEKGIVYFICWWWLDQESLDDFAALNDDERVQPSSVCCGPHLYGVDCVARKGHGFEMTRTIKNLFKNNGQSIQWHRNKNKVKLVSFKGVHRHG